MEDERRTGRGERGEEKAGRGRESETSAKEFGWCDDKRGVGRVLSSLFPLPSCVELHLVCVCVCVCVCALNLI